MFSLKEFLQENRVYILHLSWLAPEERCSDFLNFFFVLPAAEHLSREWSKKYISSQALWRVF